MCVCVCVCVCYCRWSHPLVYAERSGVRFDMILIANSSFFPSSPHFFASPLLSFLPSSLVISFPFLRLCPAPLPPSSLAAVCSATCEYSITFQTAPCTAQLTEISLFPAPLFCSRGADKREERGLLRGWPFFFLLFFSFRDKQRPAKALAWLKWIIYRHECEICTRDFFFLWHKKQPRRFALFEEWKYSRSNP